MKSGTEYWQFTKPAELHKAVNTLRGLIAGISSADGITEKELTELVNWCELHSNLRDRHPFSELIPVIEKSMEDGKIDSEEKDDILWLCNNFVDDSKYYDITTSSVQFLNGLVHGIMADGTVGDSEIQALKQWLDVNDFLRGTYPFDELQAFVYGILADNKITEDERNSLTAFMSNLIEFKDSYNLIESDYVALREKYSIDGVCALTPDVVFNERVFCFTGESYRVARKEFEEIVEKLGGIFRNSVSNKTDYLVVGNAGNRCWAYSCYGRKIEQAMSLRREGGKIQIVNENDFWDAADDAK